MKLASILLLIATLAACHGGAAADPKALPPAPGHVLTTFTLEDAPTCESCTGRMHLTLDGTPGLSSVDARIGDHTLRVWHDAQALPAEQILAMLNTAGEKATLP